MIPPAPFPAFGRRLKHLRIAARIKQDALARHLGVSQTTVSRWESGVQAPGPELQHAALACLPLSQARDAALRRLVESSADAVHLVAEASHVCLAYSQARARDWNTTGRALLGTSLWQFATDEIRQAESELEGEGWWESAAPPPKSFLTSEALHPEIRINAGIILWERVYLADGTPARLVSGFRDHA